MINKLVVALTYYNAPLMLQEQIKHWLEYPDDLSTHMKVILIDDGSMVHHAEKEIKNSNLKIPVELYRITKDIPQNTFGARNLAFHIASVEGAKWVLSLDIDHVLPSSGLAGFRDLKANLLPDFFYYPNRFGKGSDGIYYGMSRHSDTYLISPELYWRVGGYDEDLTGYYYNGAAFHFRKALSQVSKGIEIEKMYTLFYSSSLISDASPLQDKEKESYKGNYPKDKKPSVLNFEWERVL